MLVKKRVAQDLRESQRTRLDSDAARGSMLKESAAFPEVCPEVLLSRDPEACPFCSLDMRRALLANEAALALRDGFPVNSGHTLIVLRRHVASWFDATRDEQLAILELLDLVKEELDRTLAPAGYNVGVNVGAAAGQTVPHLHVHVIPRFPGDVDDPTGGVRLVIPERGNYRRAGHVPRGPRSREP
jgi:diadenosine tetraphosphate (Ap4A) HIT family hydrolase